MFPRDWLRAAAFISVAASFPLHSSPTTVPTLIDLGYSKYQGSALDAGVNQYLGVRYAAPPIGDLRWRAPADPEVTNATQDASAFGPICLGIGDVFPTPGEDEDCLFVNVWTPSNATRNSKLPVWFFIQGGGYVTDANANYNGTDVVQKSGGNIVFVNMNYRVAAWGYLASEKLRKDGDLNAGFLDQRKALEWVQKYIHLFGGDPDHVVIHGDSAGAGSVAFHLTAFGGRDDGLFIGGIGESVFFPWQPKVSELEWQFDRFAKDAGCGNSTDELACLRSQGTATLQAANVGSPFPGRNNTPDFYFSPAVDGILIQDYPYRLFQEKKIIKVPIIFGDDTNEGSGFAANAATPEDVAVFMKDNYPPLTKRDTDEINRLYPLMPPLPEHSGAYFPSASAAYGESTFTCPGLFISDVFAEVGAPVWNYRVNVQDPASIAAGFGVAHTMEIPAIFGVGFAGGVGGTFSNINAPIVPVFMDYWISFIRELDPNQFKSSAAPRWENFTQRKQQRVVLQTNDTRMENVPEDQKERCAFWARNGAKFQQ